MNMHYDLKSSLKLVLVVLRVLGMWPEGRDSYSTPYKIYSLTVILSLAFMHTLLQILNLIYIYNDLELLTSSMYVSIMCGLCVFKAGLFAHNLPKIKLLMRILDEDIFQPKNQRQTDILKSFQHTWKLSSITFYILGVMTILLSALFPVLDATYKNGRLPYLAWYPFSHTSSPVYELTYIHQVVGVSHICIMNISFDNLIAAMMNYIAGQCAILSDDLKNMCVVSRDDEELALVEINDRCEFENFLKCIEHHKTILHFSEQCNQLLSGMVMGQFATSVFCLCVTMFQLSILKPFTSEFNSMMCYEMCISWQIFSYCFFGNQVIVYILRSSWSYFALLRQVNK